MSPEADHKDRMNGVRAAMEIQNRLYGKPVEKLAVAGRVKIEFGGLNPNVFPQQEPEAGKSEIIELVGTEGVEIPGDPVEVPDGVQTESASTDTAGPSLRTAVFQTDEPNGQTTPHRRRRETP
jgi:hypothetical protein